MTIEVTDDAAAVLKRSLEIGKVDGSTGGIRLRGARALGGSFGVQVELADGPVEGDEVIETAGLRLFVERSVIEAMPDPVVTLEPEHSTIVVRDRRTLG
jgi:hypothetical protein